MDRGSLEALLAKGLSLAEIGRQTGKDPSTVGYWVKKHGLTAVNADKHASRGGLTRELLAELIGKGLSVREIATRTQFAPTTVRYWLRRHGLATTAAERRDDGRRAKAKGRTIVRMRCQTHGETEFRSRAAARTGA